MSWIRLLLLLPFFLTTLVPYGMMLPLAQSGDGNVLVLCTSHGTRVLTKSEIQDLSIQLPSSDHAAAETPDNNCPYSIANGAFVNTATPIKLLTPAAIQPKQLARYNAKYLLNLYPAGFPRGPPLLV